MGNLILTRKVGESIFIGDKAQINISVLGIKGVQVRIAIDAPKNVPVHREEIYNKILAKKQNKEIENSGNI